MTRIKRLILCLIPLVGLAPSVRSQANGDPAESNYALGPNDIVLVKVFQEPDLDSQYRIPKDGIINFPLVGTIKVGGLTIGQAAGVIKESLAQGYLRHPEVRVNILQYAKRRFTVIGEVQHPGTYLMDDEHATDLLSAIASAGGFTKVADTHKVVIRRKNGTEDNLLAVDAKSQTKDKSTAAFEVLPDDTITVGERLF